MEKGHYSLFFVTLGKKYMGKEINGKDPKWDFRLITTEVIQLLTGMEKLNQGFIREPT